MENLPDILRIGGLAIIAAGLFLGAYAVHLAEKALRKKGEDLSKNFTDCPDCMSPINKKAKVCLSCGWRAN
jgi:hypothetical protein